MKTGSRKMGAVFILARVRIKFPRARPLGLLSIPYGFKGKLGRRPQSSHVEIRVWGGRPTRWRHILRTQISRDVEVIRKSDVHQRLGV